MSANQIDVILRVPPGEDDDREEVRSFVAALEREISELDVEDVEVVPAGDAPPGAKGAAIDLTTLVVTLAGSAPLSALLGLLQAWISRTDTNDRTIELEVDGDRIRLTGASATSERQLVAEWLSRREGRRG